MFLTAADSVFAVNILPSCTNHTINIRAQQQEQPRRLPTRFTRQLNFYCQMLLCKHHYIDFDTDVNNHAALKASRRSPEDRKISRILSSSVFVSRILLFIDYWHTCASCKHCCWSLQQKLETSDSGVNEQMVYSSRRQTPLTVKVQRVHHHAVLDVLLLY